MMDDGGPLCAEFVPALGCTALSIKAFNEMAKLLKKSKQMELEWSGAVMASSRRLRRGL